MGDSRLPVAPVYDGVAPVFNPKLPERERSARLNLDLPTVLALFILTWVTASTTSTPPPSTTTASTTTTTAWLTTPCLTSAKLLQQFICFSIFNVSLYQFSRDEHSRCQN